MDLKFLIAHEAIHFLAALPFAVFLYWRFKKWSLVLLLYLVVHFVDIDHMIDYFLWAGPTFHNPLSMNFFNATKKIYVLFHGWEYVLILLFFAWKFKKVVPLVIALGLTSHFLVDQFAYQTHIFSYSIIYRILHGFSQSSLNLLSL